jgi:uncharacterized membrane protein
MSDLEKALGRVLGIGVALSTVTLAAGLMAVAVGGSSSPLAIRLLSIGVLILIGTPVARVVVSLIAYARRHDRTFTLLALIVLGELIASIVAALRG